MKKVLVSVAQIEYITIEIRTRAKKKKKNGCQQTNFILGRYRRLL